MRKFTNTASLQETQKANSVIEQTAYFEANVASIFSLM